MVNTRFLSLVVILLTSCLLHAQVPEGYFRGTTGLKGEALKARLHEIIRNHKSFIYRNLWEILSDTDQDPDNPENVILLYSGWSHPASDHGGNTSQWNREHTWAKSRGDFGNRRPAGTDAHHLRPTDVTVNSKRGNLDFDEGGTRYIDPDGSTDCFFDENSWEPRDAVKGDVARMLFYMATRYEGGEGIKDLELMDETTPNSKEPRHGRISILLKWHKQDPVDDFERRRNDRVFGWQENRNPYIDHPEFVGLVFGQDEPEPEPEPEPIPGTTVLVVYSAGSGTTKQLAEAIAAGVGEAGGRAITKPVDEVTREELEAAAGLILGSPTANANMASEVNAFLERISLDWNLFLEDKVGAAFSTAETPGGGREHVVTSLLMAMLTQGMVVVGPIIGEDSSRTGALGASALNSRINAGQAEAELDAARLLGVRVVNLAMRLADEP